MNDYQYDSPWSSRLAPVEPVNVSTNMVYDPAPREEADAPLVVEAPRPAADLDVGPAAPPAWTAAGMSTLSVGAFVVRLTAPVTPPAPDPVVLTYDDLAALEAAAMLAVGQGLLAPPDPDADPWDEEEDAAASRMLAVVWRKLNHARRDGRPVVVEPTMRPERSRPSSDPLDDLGDR